MNIEANQNLTAFTDSLMEQAYASADSMAENIQGFVYTTGNAELNPVLRNTPAGPEEWAILVLLLGFALLVLSRRLFPRLFIQSMQAALANNHLNQMLRENNPANHFIGILFFTSYSLLFALFLFIMLPAFGNMQTNADSTQAAHIYAAIVIMVILMLAFKLVLTRVLARLFRTGELAMYFTAHHFSFFLIGSFLFLILLLINLYNPDDILLIISLLITGLFMGYRFIRSFMATLPLAQFGFIYLFMYLCALEIVPLMLLVKIVLQLGNGSLIT